MEMQNTVLVDGVEFGLMLVVCGNAETICNWEDPTGNGNEDECRKICGAVHDSLSAVGLDSDSDSYFPHWHGGRFSRWERRGIVAFAAFFRGVEIDGDGEKVEEPWQSCKLSDCPPQWEWAIEAAADAADKARDIAIDAQDERQRDFAVEDLQEAAQNALSVIDDLDVFNAELSDAAERLRSALGRLCKLAAR